MLGVAGDMGISLTADILRPTESWCSTQSGVLLTAGAAGSCNGSSTGPSSSASQQLFTY
jgi:hypothetical protein